MASVLIRNADDALHRRLKASADAHQRSLEDEARKLLRLGVARQSIGLQENLADIAERLFGREHGMDLEIPAGVDTSERPALDFSSPAYDPTETK